MDEIELIRELRANLPGARAAGREAARAALLERIEQVEGSTSPPSALKWSIRRTRILAAAVSALVLAVAVPILLFGGSEAGVQSAAAKVLREAADLAALQPPETPGPGQYLFTRSKVGYLEYSLQEGGRVAARTRREFMRIWHTHNGMKVPSWWYFVTGERDRWIRPNGSGWGREISGQARFLSARQRAAWVAAGSPQLPKAGRISLQRFERFHRDSLTFSRLARLPTDPHKLRRWIETQRFLGGISTAGTTSTGLAPIKSGYAPVFAHVGSLLGEAAAPPALRAALYRVASELPGVQLLGTVTDPVGRTGTGVAYTDPTHGQRLELIFDPKTSTLLAERYVLTSSRRSGIAAPAGTVVGYMVHLASRVVDSESVPAVANMRQRTS